MTSQDKMYKMKFFYKNVHIQETGFMEIMTSQDKMYKMKFFTKMCIIKNVSLGQLKKYRFVSPLKKSNELSIPLNLTIVWDII